MAILYIHQSVYTCVYIASSNDIIIFMNKNNKTVMWSQLSHVINDIYDAFTFNNGMSGAEILYLNRNLSVSFIDF